MTTLPPRRARTRIAELYSKEKRKVRWKSLRFGRTGAGNESRTRDLNLGKVALYQLSYSRVGRGL